MVVDFEKIYQTGIRPLLLRYEGERKTEISKIFPKALLIFIMWFVLGYIMANSVQGNYNPFYFISVIASFVHITIIYKLDNYRFRKKMKYRLLNSILSYFGKLYWCKEELISQNELHDTCIFPLFTTKNDNDNIVGKYNGINLYITETELYHDIRGGRHKHYVTDFKGIILKVEMNKNFTGRTIVRTKQFMSNILFNGFEKLELENTEFNSKYDVYSTDEVEGRYILTTSFMERLSKLENAFYTKNVQCVFLNGFVYFFLSTSRNFFEVSSINSSLLKRKRYERVFNEIMSVLDMIDHFKLNQKLGF